MCFPESEQFLRAKEQGQKGGHTKQFMKEAAVVVKTQWRRIIYACIVSYSKLGEYRERLTRFTV